MYPAVMLIIVGLGSLCRIRILILLLGSMMVTATSCSTSWVILLVSISTTVVYIFMLTALHHLSPFAVISSCQLSGCGYTFWAKLLNEVVDVSRIVSLLPQYISTSSDLLDQYVSLLPLADLDALLNNIVAISILHHSV
jgi:hypothetical protein